jgi:hypothetical protein
MLYEPNSALIAEQLAAKSAMPLPPRSDWRAETIENRWQEAAEAEQLRLGEYRHELGIGDSTGEVLNDAIEQLLKWKRYNR